MKFALSITCLFLFTVKEVSAQTRKTYKVNPGQSIVQALPNEAVYLYPSFKNGTVNFKNTHVGAAKINYNRLLDAIQFIDNKGDTLALNDEATIESIYTDSDTFYYFQGFVKKMDEVKHARFTSKKMTVLSNKQKLGGMGELSSASIETYEKISSSQGSRDMVQKEILTFADYSTFFIGDKYNHFKPLNKKNLINSFSKQEYDIENYLRENSISLLKEEDVKKLIGFLKML